MSTKYVPLSKTKEQAEEERIYLERGQNYQNLYMLGPKRERLVSKAQGLVLEIASGCLQTLSHYAQSETEEKVKMIVFTEPMDMCFDVGMGKISNMIDNQSDRYTGSYEKVTNIKDANGSQINAWKFIFTQTQGDLGPLEKVPINIPCFYLQTALDGVGDIVRQVLPSGANVDTVLSSFGVCYVCCSVHPLDYIVNLQTIFGPTKAENTYRLCLLEHGVTQHLEINPLTNKWVLQDGGVKFRHLFHLMADSRIIIHDLEHHLETNDPAKATFHIYEAEPNDQREWVKNQAKKTQ